MKESGMASSTWNRFRKHKCTIHKYINDAIDQLNREIVNRKRRNVSPEGKTRQPISLMTRQISVVPGWQGFTYLTHSVDLFIFCFLLQKYLYKNIFLGKPKKVARIAFLRRND